MKKTSAISTLEASQYIELIDEALAKLKSYENNVADYIKIIEKNNEMILAKLRKSLAEEYQREFDKIAAKYEISQYFEPPTNRFAKMLEEKMSIHRYVPNLKEGVNINEIDPHKQYGFFVDEVAKLGRQLYAKYNEYVAHSKVKEIHSGITIKAISSALENMKHLISGYIRSAISWKDAFVEIPGKPNTKILKDRLDEYFEEIINSTLSRITDNMDDILSKDEMDRMVRLSKERFMLWLNSFRLENMEFTMENDIPVLWRQPLIDKINELNKELQKFYDRLRVDWNAEDKIRHASAMRNKLKKIYGTLAVVVDDLDPFGQKKFEELMAQPLNPRIGGELETLGRKLEIGEAFREGGKLSFKKVSGALKELLSKYSGIPEKNVKKILGGLVKNNYGYVLADTMVKVFENSPKRELQVANIVFERMYGRKITSVEDFIKYYELHNSMLDLRDEIVGHGFNSTQYSEMLNVFTRYFENIKPNKRIKISSLIEGFKTQAKRYADLQDTVHNNLNIYHIYNDGYVGKKLRKEFDDKIMSIAGGKKYSVPHKDLTNVISSLIGFDQVEDEDEWDDYDYDYDYDTIKDPIGEEAIYLTEELIKYLESLVDKYRPGYVAVKGTGIVLYQILESKIKGLNSVLMRTIDEDENLVYKEQSKKVLGGYVVNHFLVPEPWMHALTPEELEKLQKMAEVVAYDCNIPLSLGAMIGIRKSLFLENIKNLDDDILLSVGLTNDPYLENDPEDKEPIIHIGDALDELAYAFMHPEKFSFSKLKELSELGKKIMYVISVANVKGGYKEWFNKVESLADVEKEIDYELPKVTGKHPALFDLNMEVGDDLVFKVLPSNDPRHLTIGIETDCCQRLGGAGEGAAIDSFINPLAGVLILEKKDGTLLAQSYLHYVPEKNIYILDNIEGFPNKLGEEKMERAYFELARKIGEKKGVKSFRIGQPYTELGFLTAGEGEVEDDDDDPRYFAVDRPYSDYSGGSEYWDLLKEEEIEPGETRGKFDYRPFEKALAHVRGQK